MRITIDTRDIDKLTEAMGKYSGIMPNSKANSVLRKSVRPMLMKTKAEVPVQTDGQERIRISSARKAIGRNSDPNYLRQHGATRRDLRTKAVKAEAGEVGRVIVGVNKRRGKVGWRTPFITRGTGIRRTKRGANRGRMTANDFLQRSYDQTIDFVRQDFLKEYREAFAAWARATWPQITR